MRCPNCGWHVRGGARFCPNCGAEMPAEEPRTCPLCRTEVKGQVSLCPNCGAALDGEVPEPTPKPPPAPAEPPEAPAEAKDATVRTCPSCKSKLKGKVGICPVCGEDLSGPRPATRRRRAPTDWPFGAPADSAERPLASKMKPLSPNWPFDEPEPPKEKKRSKKAKQTAESKAEAEQAGEDKATAAAKAGEGKPEAPKAPDKAKPAPSAPAKPQAPKSEKPAGRGPAEPARPASPPPGGDRPPEVKPWYVARPAEARPGAAQRPSPAARPTPPPRPRPAARPAAHPTQPAKARKGLGLLPWLGGLVGVVFVSILIYGFAVGGLGLPHLGAAAPVEEPTATVQPTEAPTQTPQPTPTGTPLPPTPTAEPVVHVVQAGESLLSIANDYGVAVEDLIAANSITDTDVLRVGQELIIPGASAPAEPTAAGEAPTEAAAEPTAAPTEAAGAATATPAAGETPGAQPTPLPTATAALEFSAPNLLNPADGAVFGGEDILLNWSSVGLLGDDTWYVVKIWTDDPDQAAPATGWTRTTAWRIPVSSRPPADAASHTFYWTVTVMRAVEGQEAVAISPVSETRTFEWQ